MEARAEFLKKLNDLVTVVREKGNQITVDEVKTYFSGMDLNEEQIELVFDYLLAQKVVVKGYIKMQEAQVEKFKKLEEKLLPENIDYEQIKTRNTVKPLIDALSVLIRWVLPEPGFCSPLGGGFT